MRVAVVGGGIFGCTAASYLARDGHDVHLLERKDGLLRCASGINQLRLHAGYHYPRSPETIRECQAALVSFKDWYGEAVVTRGRHFYGIAREGSRLTPQAYLNALCEHGLDHDIASSNGLVDLDSIEMMVEAREQWIDIARLRGLAWEWLAQHNVTVHLNAPADGSFRDEFDKVIIAGYASTNEIARAIGAGECSLQYEVCEKVVLQMPEIWQRKGLVVMDGEFCSLDPYWGTPYHLLGHVKHAVHHRVDGTEAWIPEHLREYIDRGLIYPMPMRSKIIQMLDGASVFIPALDDAEYIGSMYTVRVVQPNVDDTDARPTIVQELDAQVIRVLSGKIGCCVETAKQVSELIGTQTARAA